MWQGLRVLVNGLGVATFLFVNTPGLPASVEALRERLAPACPGAHRHHEDEHGAAGHEEHHHHGPGCECPVCLKRAAGRAHHGGEGAPPGETDSISAGCSCPLCPCCPPATCHRCCPGPAPYCRPAPAGVPGPSPCLCALLPEVPLFFPSPSPGTLIRPPRA